MQQTAVYGEGDVSYQAAGGIEGLRRLVADFYRLMDELPEATALRQLHGESLNLLLPHPEDLVYAIWGDRCAA